MHRSIALTIAVLNGLASIGVRAEEPGAHPLAEEIREQEMAVERAPGRSDGKAWLKLAVLRQNAARYVESEHAYSRAVELLKSGHPAAFADALDHMGTMYVECGQFSKAEPLLRQALAIRENAKDLLRIGVSHMHLSALLLGRGELQSAEAAAEKAVRLLVPQQSHDAARTAATPEQQMKALIDLSLVRCARDACATAIPDLRRALRIAKASYAKNSIPVGLLHFLLGYAHWKGGDIDAAAELMGNGIQELSTQLGWGHPTYVRALAQYRAFLAESGLSTRSEQAGAGIARVERPRAPGSNQPD